MRISRKKGFTLVEMVIAMAVTLVLLSMIMSLIVSVIKNTQKNEHENSVHNDLNIAEINISNWYNAFGDFNGKYIYDFSPVEITQNETGKDVYTKVSNAAVLAVFNAGTETETGVITPIATINFNTETQILHCSNKYGRLLLKNIDEITFSKKGNIIKASIYYDGEKIPIILLLSNERF